MTDEQQPNPEREARLAAETRVTQLENELHEHLINSALKDAARKSGARTATHDHLAALLRPNSRIVTDSNGRRGVVVDTATGPATAPQAIGNLKSSEDSGYFWAPPTKTVPTTKADLSKLTHEEYLEVRRKRPDLIYGRKANQD